MESAVNDWAKSGFWFIDLFFFFWGGGRQPLYHCEHGWPLLKSMVILSAILYRTKPKFRLRFGPFIQSTTHCKSRNWMQWAVACCEADFQDASRRKATDSDLWRWFAPNIKHRLPFLVEAKATGEAEVEQQSWIKRSFWPLVGIWCSRAAQQQRLEGGHSASLPGCWPLRPSGLEAVMLREGELTDTGTDR